METIRSVPEEKLSPELVAARFFDSRNSKLKSGVRTRERTTNCYEFSLYLTTGGSLFTGGEETGVVQGLWRLTPPGVKISSIPPYSCYTVLFSLFRENEKELRVKTPFFDLLPAYFVTKNTERYRPVLDELIRLSFQSGVGVVLEERRALLELFLLAKKDYDSRTVVLSEAEQAVWKAKDFLAKNLSRPVPLSELGNLVGYHPLYFQRIFKENCGKTPHEYLFSLRIQEAKRLLATTGLAVSRIAAACGFSSVSHFNRNFKKAVGKAPLAYRKQKEILP